MYFSQLHCRNINLLDVLLVYEQSRTPGVSLLSVYSLTDVSLTDRQHQSRSGQTNLTINPVKNCTKLQTAVTQFGFFFFLVKESKAGTRTEQQTIKRWNIKDQGEATWSKKTRIMTLLGEILKTLFGSGIIGYSLDKNNISLLLFLYCACVYVNFCLWFEILNAGETNI